MFLLRHLIGAAFRAFFRMLFTGILCAAVAVGAVLLVAYSNVHQWPPDRLTEAAAAAMGVLAAYAGGLTVLVQEAVRGVKTAERDVANVLEGGNAGAKRGAA